MSTVLTSEEPLSRAQLVRAPLLVGASGAALAVALHVRDPHESGSWGFCPFLLLTGQPCPGCGGLRAVNHLTNGDVTAALSSNAFAVVLVLTLAVAWLVWFVRRWRGEPALMITLGLRSGMIVMALIFAFGIFRLTPWGAALRP